MSAINASEHESLFVLRRVRVEFRRCLQRSQLVVLVLGASYTAVVTVSLGRTFAKSVWLDFILPSQPAITEERGAPDLTASTTVSASAKYLLVCKSTYDLSLISVEIAGHFLANR